MTTCMVYLRKSTNRKDKQLNTFDEQTIWVNKILWSNPDFEVIWLDGKVCEIPRQWFIYEAQTAKEGWKTREKFQQMAELIKKIGIDYLIVWQPDRLSRNSIDMATISELLRNRNMLRKGIITESHTYDGSKNDDRNYLDQKLLDAKKRMKIEHKEQRIIKNIWNQLAYFHINFHLVTYL